MTTCAELPYVYNALGQLAKQSGGTPGTALYMYDEAGHLVGEYTSAGALVQETVWLGDIPVATLRPHSGGGIDIYYVHSDNLNTPLRVTRPSDDKLMWTWYPSPFGADLPNENPASGGSFHYNLRFAGQRYDSHAELHQNLMRDYDPAIGKYMQSDPVGLQAGVNTYTYVGSSPLDFVDPTGLDETHDVNTNGGRHVWDGPTNGNWGGKCWSGGQYSCGGHPMGKAPPTDSGDMCYMHHDHCYANCGGDKLCMAACNQTLIGELKALPSDPAKWPVPPRHGTNGDSIRYRDWATRYFSHVSP